MRKLKDDSVIVMLGSAGLSRLPSLVRRALRSPEAGRFIPRTVVTDAESSEVISIVPYARGRRMFDQLEEARQRISRAATRKSSTALIEDQRPAKTATRLVLVLRWKGRLQPMPLLKATSFLDRMGYPFKLIKSGPHECRFRVTLDEPKERFAHLLQTFLQSHYRLEIKSDRSQMVYRLANR